MFTAGYQKAFYIFEPIVSKTNANLKLIATQPPVGVAILIWIYAVGSSVTVFISSVRTNLNYCTMQIAASEINTMFSVIPAQAGIHSVNDILSAIYDARVRRGLGFKCWYLALSLPAIVWRNGRVLPCISPWQGEFDIILLWVELKFHCFFCIIS